MQQSSLLLQLSSNCVASGGQSAADENNTDVVATCSHLWRGRIQLFDFGRVIISRA